MSATSSFSRSITLGGFQVTMQDAGVVHDAQRVRDVLDIAKRFALGDADLHARLQVAARKYSIARYSRPSCTP